MSYRRNGPNVSAYLKDLNTISSPQEPLQPAEPAFGMSDDLAQFTNATFFDFDLGRQTEDMAKTSEEYKGRSVNYLDAIPFNGYQNFEHGLQYGSTLQIDPSLHMIPAFQEPLPAAVPLASNATPPASLSSPVQPDTRHNTEEAARFAAEEDKRRRNTAASARFRDKKKLREKAMERDNKEMSEKISSYEARIKQLETENRWLKELITEKTSGKDKIDGLKQ